MSDALDKLSDAAFDWVHCAEHAAHDLAGPSERENRQHARESFFAALQSVDAELAEAKKDAERYRHLRREESDFEVCALDCGSDGTGLVSVPIPVHELDEAIDASIECEAV